MDTVANGYDGIEIIERSVICFIIPGSMCKFCVTIRNPPCFIVYYLIVILLHKVSTSECGIRQIFHWS